jgi:hypothetical protein
MLTLSTGRSDLVSWIRTKRTDLRRSRLSGMRWVSRRRKRWKGTTTRNWTPIARRWRSGRRSMVSIVTNPRSALTTPNPKKIRTGDVRLPPRRRRPMTRPVTKRRTRRATRPRAKNDDLRRPIMTLALFLNFLDSNY